MDPAQDLDQSRLTAPVLADEGVHLAAAQVERAVPQCLGGAERLGHVRNAEQQRTRFVVEQGAGRCRHPVSVAGSHYRVTALPRYWAGAGAGPSAQYAARSSKGRVGPIVEPNDVPPTSDPYRIANSRESGAQCRPAKVIAHRVRAAATPVPSLRLPLDNGPGAGVFWARTDRAI